MQMVDSLVEILGTIPGICDAHMVPAWGVSSFWVAGVLGREALPHLPSREEREEPCLPIRSTRGIGDVLQNLLLHSIGDAARIILDELPSLLVMYLPKSGKDLTRRAQEG